MRLRTVPGGLVPLVAVDFVGAVMWMTIGRMFGALTERGTTAIRQDCG
jgi:hypothetical protein